MIIKNNQNIAFIYQGLNPMQKVYKGMNLVWNKIKKKLPIEYQEVAYITGTGSQFIDTGIIPNSSTSVKIKCAIANVSLNNIVFGSRTTGTYSTSKDQFYSGINGNVASDIFAYSGTTRNSIIPNAENNKFYEWECLNNKATGTNIYPIYLFMLNNKGTTTSSTTEIKMAKFKIWNNGALVRNMIPCYRKLDDEPGLYDIVNDVFYTNQGTGEFLVGPDIVNLPSEYQEVEYIESTGTQYIDTGVQYATDLIVYDRISYTYLNNASQSSVQYNVNGVQSSVFWGIMKPKSSNSWSWSTGNDSGVSPIINTIYNLKVDINKKTLYVDGVEVAKRTTAVSGSGNMYLFAIKERDTNKVNMYEKYTRRYNTQFYKNKELIREFIPCYRKSDNVAGLYDVVNDVFYTNEGTGEFIVGPEIVNLPSEYQQVEYIETTGSQYINTNFIPNSNTKIELTYMLTAIRTQIVFGSRAEADSSRAYNGVFITHRSANAKIAWSKGANSNIEIQGYNDINTQYTAFFDKNKVYINDNLVHNFNEIIWEGNYPIFVGCVNTKGSPEYYGKCKYYNFKIWNENVLDRYLIPCYRKLDNVAGFYDLVNDVFYINSGTGEFIVGEDI